MTANPALVRTVQGELVPAPFASEMFLLKRPTVGFELDGVQTRSGKWSTSGALYLSNIRLVFVATKADESGLAGFDMPLVYITKEELKQPIFGCNNLSGVVWPAVPGGGPSGTLPPHNFKVLFKEGGMGTFYPLFYTMLQRSKRADAAAQQNSLQQSKALIDDVAQKAFVDPNDPTTIYLTQPVEETQRLQYQPVYAANYGKDNAPYEPMDPRH